MTQFVIIGKEPGSVVDWLGEASSAAEAAAKYADETGIEVSGDEHIIEVSFNEAKQIDAWIDQGYPADTAPDCLYRR